MLAEPALFNNKTLDESIDTAYQWLCQQRKHFPPNADVWHLRFHWSRLRPQLKQQCLNGCYTLSPLQAVTMACGKTIHLWSACDALVLKMLTKVLGPMLGISPHCTHVKGHGGLKASVRELQQALPEYTFVMKTDVKQYYESINHTLLLRQLNAVITDRFAWRLLYQYVNRSIDKGGNFHNPACGISRGCPLSPLMGAFYLKGLDEELGSNAQVYYVRYMDDIIILAKTRWHLRGAIKTLNSVFNALKLSQAPNKTFIGYIEKGFDFLGYYFSRKRLSLAAKTIENALEKRRQLYEQQKTAPDKGAAILGDYVTRWRRWTRAGLSGLELSALCRRDFAAKTQSCQTNRQ